MNNFDFQNNDRKLQEKIRGKEMMEIKETSNLPHDLIIEILSRIPPKAVSKFRCVSKQWYTLLTYDKEFIARHVEWSKKNPHLLMRRYILDENGELSKRKATIELTSVNMEGNATDKFRIVIDGLVHTFISCGPLTLLCCMYSLYVCDPSFHKTSRVPFRSRTRSQHIGFGLLPTSNVYKIVHLFEESYLNNRNMFCEILTFRDGDAISSNSWRRTKEGSCPWSACTEKYPLCVNGNIYWARSSGWKNRSILSLDLEDEDFSIIHYPSCDYKVYNLMEFTGIKGCLYVIGCSSEKSTLDVWQWDKNEKIWVMEHCIRYFSFTASFLISSDYESEEILIHTEEKGLISYCTKTRNSRRIKYFEGVRSNNKPCLYHYNLIPLLTTNDGY